MILSTEDLTILLGAALPVSLIVLFLLFRWRYLRAIRRTIYSSAPNSSERSDSPAPATSAAEPLVIAWSDVASSRQKAQSPALSEAARDALAVRAIFSVSGAAFVIVAAAVVWVGQRMHFDARVAGALAYFSTIPGFAIVLLFTRPSWWSILAVASAWIGAGLLYLVGAIGLQWVQIPGLMWSGLDFSAAPLAAVALLALRTLRPLLVAFVPLVGLLLLLSGLTIGLLELFDITLATRPSAEAVALGTLNFIIGTGLAVRVFRRGVRRWHVIAFLVAVASGVYAASRDLPIVWMIPAGIGTNAIAALAVGWLFIRFLRLKASGYLPDEILHFCFCWLVLTAFVPVLASMPLWPAWFVLPLAAFITILFLLLKRRRRLTPSAPPKRLLLLRVFERTRRRRRLLDTLDDGWRRVGRVDLVVGVDFADRTLSPAALENFLLGRVHRQFVSSEAESVRRVTELASRKALDGRHPLNELHCLPHIWPHVVTQLARACDVVLMDLRGLRRTNAGALFELALIVDRVPLDRIVLLADTETDEVALSETARSAWARLAVDSPNKGYREPRLRLLRYAGWRADDTAITQAILLAAGGQGEPASVS